MPHRIRPGCANCPLSPSYGRCGSSNSTPSQSKPDFREAKDLPPSTLLICTPYEAEARYSQKRGMFWTGYKVHVTQSCDDDGPHLVTDVQTTPAPVSDFDMTPTIQATLAQRDLLPNEHVLDAGYVTAAHMISSQTDYGIDLVGPIAADNRWQAQATHGFGTADFTIDWQEHTAHCPQGQQSVVWMARQDRNEHEVIHIKFAAKECLVCPVRSQCTHALKEPRSIMIRAQPTYEVLQHARQRQQTPAFKEVYAKRAGIEGTLSEARTGVWTPTISLRGRSKNTLTNVHDGSRHQCRSHWSLDRGTATRAHSSLSFCCFSTNWVMDELRQCFDFANRILSRQKNRLN